MFELTDVEKTSVIINFRNERELAAEAVVLLRKINIKLLGLSPSIDIELNALDISLRGLGIAWHSDLARSISCESEQYPIVFVLTPSQLLLYFKNLEGNNYDSIFIGCLMLRQLGVIKRIVK